MQDPLTYKSLIPNIIIFFTSLYVASKDHPLAFFAGSLLTLVAVIVWAYIKQKKVTRDEERTRNY